MTLLWFCVALILYIEVILLILLSIPSIPSSVWKIIFQNSYVETIHGYWQTYSSIVAVFLIILLADSVREMIKYDAAHESMDDMPMGWAQNDALVNSRLFRAQRNFYLVSGNLFMYFVIRRMVALILQIADIEEQLQPQQ